MDPLNKLHPANSAPFTALLSLLFCAPLLPEYIAAFLSLIIFFFLISSIKKEKITINLDRTAKLTLIFIAFMALNSLRSPNPLFSAGLTYLWLLLFSTYLAVTSLTASFRGLENLFGSITLSGGIAGIIGVLQIVFYELRLSFPNPFWQNLDDFIFHYVPFDIVYNDLPQRASATFNNPNVYGAFLILVFPLAVYSTIAAKKLSAKITASASALCIFAGIAASYSRGCYLALLLSCIILIFFTRKSRFKLLIPITGLIFLIPGSIQSRLFSVASMDNSMLIRTNIWKSSLTAASENLLFGIGPGTNVVGNMLHSQFSIKQPHAHNLYLELLVENGLIGLLIFMAIVISFLYKMILLIVRSDGNGKLIGVTFISIMVGFLFIGLTDFPLVTPKLIQYFMIMLALGEAGRRLNVQDDSSSSLIPKKIHYFCKNIQFKKGSADSGHLAATFCDQNNPDD